MNYSSFLPLPKSCAHLFPAHGNAYGVTAGCKIDLIIDLLSGQAIEANIYHGNTQDKEIGNSLTDLLGKGDLVIRDMGYYGVEIFDDIQSKHAHWLSRLPLNVEVFTHQGKSLERILKYSKSDRIDEEVFITAKQKKVRLVAIRANREQSNQRRRQRRQLAKQQGKTPSPKGLIRDGWHLLITSVDKSTLDAKEMGELYKQRWKIEIIFRGWKQSTDLSKALKRKTNPQHTIALVLAGLIFLVLTMRCFLMLGKMCIHSVLLSYEKVAMSLSSYIMQQKTLLSLGAYAPDLRLIQRQKRKRKSLADQLLSFLA